MTEAARRVGVHGATVVRWILRGARLSDGTRLTLAATRLPGRWLIADEDVDGFIARLTADRLRDGDRPAPREQAGEPSRARAGRILDEAGIR